MNCMNWELDTEDPGIDPGTSRMLSELSPIWASPSSVNHYEECTVYCGIEWSYLGKEYSFKLSCYGHVNRSKYTRINEHVITFFALTLMEVTMVFDIHAAIGSHNLLNIS